VVKEVDGCLAKTVISAISPKLVKHWRNRSFKLIKSVVRGGRKVPSKTAISAISAISPKLSKTGKIAVLN